MRGGSLICGWVCHRLWTSVAVLGSWVIVVGTGWSFVSGWAVIHGLHFPFEGYGPSLVVLGHGSQGCSIWPTYPAFLHFAFFCERCIFVGGPMPKVSASTIH